MIDFLQKKKKVKYVLILKGLERRHKIEAQQKVEGWLKTFENHAKWEKVQIENNSIFTVLFPLK